MNISIVFCLRSLLEIVSIYCFYNIISEGKRIKTYILVPMSICVAAIVLLSTNLGVPYIPLIILILCVITLKIASRDSFITVLGNLVFGIVVTFILELIVIGIAIILRVSSYTGSYIIIAVLGIVATAAAIIGSSESLSSRFNQLFFRNKRMLPVISVCLILPVIILSNFFLDESIMFWGGYYGVPLLSILYVIMSIFLIKSFLDISKKESEIKAISEYGDYLKEVTEELNRREHEYKNQLNTIIGIAEMDDSQCSRKIVEYAKKLLSEVKGRGATSGSIVSDNSIVAAYVFKMAKTAKQQGIEFDYSIARPFPKYGIPDYELIEVISNLVNNALEAAASLSKEKRSVSLSMEENFIEINNFVNDSFNDNDIHRFGQTGFSTKGKNRGYGMNNVQHILDKYGASMEIYLKGDVIGFILKFSGNKEGRWDK